MAGERYIIFCTVTKQDTLSVTPDITWLGPNGVEISDQMNSTLSDGGTVVSSASLEFDPLLTSHGGIYMCQVSLTSPTLSLPLNSTATTTVTVQSKLQFDCNDCINFILFFSPTLVPQPTVEVSALPDSGPLYAGSNVSLKCTIEIDSVVDVPYLVTVEWQKSGAILSSNDRVSVSNITQQSSYLYQASVQLNPLSVTADSGMYTCRVTVDSNPRLLYIQRAIQSDAETITVQSKRSCLL